MRSKYDCNKDGDCSSGKCSLGKCIVDSCKNSKLDADSESDVDCGKSCDACGIGKSCSSGNDCTTGYCTNGICAEDKCSNGLLDDGEIDVDCGGECIKCDVGQACIIDEDCRTGNCDDGICGETKPPVNPLKLPLLLIGIVFILAGAGYIIYKAYTTKPLNTGFKSGYMGYTNKTTGPATSVPTLTAAQRQELTRRQQEAMMKKRESRSAERKDVLDKLGVPDSDIKDPDAKKSSTGTGKIGPDGEYIELSKLDKGKSEEYIDSIRKLRKRKILSLKIHSTN